MSKTGHFDEDEYIEYLVLLEVSQTVAQIVLREVMLYGWKGQEQQGYIYVGETL